MGIRVGAGEVVVEIGALACADLPALCALADEQLARVPAARLVCEVAAGRSADLVLVDALVRLRLVAKRRGRTYRIRDAPEALGDLLGLVGLRAAVPLGRGTAEPTGPGPDPALVLDVLGVLGVLEVRRQPEEREQVLGIEERVEADDAAV